MTLLSLTHKQRNNRIVAVCRQSSGYIYIYSLRVSPVQFSSQRQSQVCVWSICGGSVCECVSILKLLTTSRLAQKHTCFVQAYLPKFLTLLILDLSLDHVDMSFLVLGMVNSEISCYINSCLPYLFCLKVMIQSTYSGTNSIVVCERDLQREWVRNIDEGENERAV